MLKLKGRIISDFPIMKRIRKTQEDSLIAIQLTVIFLPGRKLFIYSYLFSSQHWFAGPSNIFNKRQQQFGYRKQGFFFHRGDTPHPVIVATLPPPPSLRILASLCVPVPLVLREPLSIVRKYKRRSLEVQISVVALWGF